MTAARPKPQFAPLPLRILSDTELTAQDLRVLGVIASKDRFGKNGSGCYASNSTIGTEAGCAPSSVRRSITRLEKHGAVKDLNALPGTRRTRRRMLVVVYRDADMQSCEQSADVSRPAHISSSVKSQSSTISNNIAKPFVAKQKQSSAAAGRPRKRRAHAAHRRKTEASIKEASVSTKAWYLEYQQARRRRDEEVETYTPPSAASRERVARMTCEHLPKLRHAHLSDYVAPPSARALEAQLRRRIGDDAYDQIPDVQQKKVVCNDVPLGTTEHEQQAPCQRVKPPNVGCDAFEAMQRASRNTGLHRQRGACNTGE